MVYNCDQCRSALPGGVKVCPKCGEEFNDAVPMDAEVPRKGFTAASNPNARSIPGPAEKRLSRPDGNSFAWLDPPARRGAPAESGALARALIVLAIAGTISLVVYFLK